MGLFRLTALALLSLQVIDAAKADVKTEPKTDLKIGVHATFPESEVFGVKLINGIPTQPIITYTNDEEGPITVSLIGGSLWSTDQEPPQIVRNLTTQKYNVVVPAGEQTQLPYSFATELHPQDLRLNLQTMVVLDSGMPYTLSAYNGTVSVVEAETSIFDPQIIFLYLFLGAAFGGTTYFIYSTWISSLFPQQRRGGKGGERAKASSRGSKKVDPSEHVAVAGGDGPTVASSKSYDESWIPAHHINKPVAKRVGSSASVKSKTKPKVEGVSSGVAT